MQTSAFSLLLKPPKRLCYAKRSTLFSSTSSSARRSAWGWGICCVEEIKLSVLVSEKIASEVGSLEFVRDIENQERREGHRLQRGGVGVGGCCCFFL